MGTLGTLIRGLVTGRICSSVSIGNIIRGVTVVTVFLSPADIALVGACSAPRSLVSQLALVWDRCSGSRQAGGAAGVRAAGAAGVRAGGCIVAGGGRRGAGRQGVVWGRGRGRRGRGRRLLLAVQLWNCHALSLTAHWAGAANDRNKMPQIGVILAPI